VKVAVALAHIDAFPARLGSVFSTLGLNVKMNRVNVFTPINWFQLIVAVTVVKALPSGMLNKAALVASIRIMPIAKAVVLFFTFVILFSPIILLNGTSLCCLAYINFCRKPLLPK
jgi:hypothetical protein